MTRYLNIRAAATALAATYRAEGSEAVRVVSPLAALILERTAGRAGLAYPSEEAA